MEREPHGRIVALSDKSYKKECQEKTSPLGWMLVHCCRGIQPHCLSGHAYSESGLPPDECFVSACAAEIRFLSPLVPFRYRDGADRFLKQQA
jgi:hypothetical protein